MFWARPSSQPLVDSRQQGPVNRSMQQQLHQANGRSGTRGMLPAGVLQQAWGMQDAQPANTDPWQDKPRLTLVSTAPSLAIDSCTHAPITGSSMERALSQDTMNLLEALVFQHPDIVPPSLQHPPAVDMHHGLLSESQDLSVPSLRSRLLSCADPQPAASRGPLAAHVQDGAGGPLMYGSHGIPTSLVHHSNPCLSPGATPALQEMSWIPEQACLSSYCYASMFEEPPNHPEAL